MALLTEEAAILAAQQALTKALIRLVDEPSGFSHTQLAKFFFPKSFVVEYTTEKNGYWLVVLDWSGKNTRLRVIISQLFKNTKFDVHVFSQREVSIPDVEEYLNKPDSQRNAHEDVDLSDISYN